MIKEEDIEKVGKAVKAHGYNGDVKIEFDQNFDEEAAEFLIVKVDGLPTPFYVEGYRYGSDTHAIYKLETIDSEAKAKELIVGKDVYVDKEHIREDEPEETEGTVYALKGYTVKECSHGTLGTVSDINDNTANILMIVEKENGDELMIPVADEYIKEIDDNNKTIPLQLPDGFLDL